MPERFLSERFDPTVHDVSGFRCGVVELDRWLQTFAEDADRRNTSRVWVWVEAGRVVAYFALAAHKVAVEEAPRSLGRGGPREIPAIILGKLALSKDLHGQHLGEQLLADALQRAVEANRVVAARLVVVEAENENVVGFYETFGFGRVPGTLRLMQKTSSIEASLT